MYYVSLVLLIVILISKYIFNQNVGGDLSKLSPYECGFSPSGDSRQKFSVSFYLIAILFIIFDLEVILLLPLASIFKYTNILGYWVSIVFIIILTIGLIYELVIVFNKKNANNRDINWNN